MSTALAIASGKGGVGKTTLAVNLAIMQASKSKCLLLDADMGMANAHILLGLNPTLTIKDVIDGKNSLEEIISEGPKSLKFISGGTGISELLNIENEKKLNFVRRFETLSNEVDNLIVDVSAGAEETSLNILSASDKILVVLVNEPTSFMDAFTLIKTCNLEFGINEFCVAVNMVHNKNQGRTVYDKFNKIVTKFYDVNISYVGSVLFQDQIKNSILKKEPAVLNTKNSNLKELFATILNKIQQAPKNNFNGIKFFSSSPKS